jgi:hypothetical protein
MSKDTEHTYDNAVAKAWEAADEGNHMGVSLWLAIAAELREASGYREWLAARKRQSRKESDIVARTVTDHAKLGGGEL